MQSTPSSSPMVPSIASTSSTRPWWKEMALRDEVVASAGRIDDVQMSLHDAVFGRADGSTVAYHKAAYYGEITHPAGSLVALLAQIAARLGASGSVRAQAVWRLDQAMGGGKSHGLIGLWHLAHNTAELAGTDLGQRVFEEARRIVGSDQLADDLYHPVCVVLDCDNAAPNEQIDGPARSLGERFLWRLFDKDYKAWKAYKGHTANKAQLARALTGIGRPVLILVDEIMDYLRWASNQDERHVLDDMAFLRALLDTVNDVANCALVVVMIASDKDNIAVNKLGEKCRAELEDLLLRNGEATTVTSGGDFAGIIRRRLFEDDPSGSAIDATTEMFSDHMSGSWHEKVFAKLNAGVTGLTDTDFAEQVARCYPFHPDLLELAQSEWSLHAGFQKVRSTIRVFAATTFALIERARNDEWVPALIGVGDLPLSNRAVRDSLLDSGLVADLRTQSSLREVALKEITDPDHHTRGTARSLDSRREAEGIQVGNPQAAERMATALFVYSLCPRPGGRRGATEPELHAAAFVGAQAYGYGESEVVMQRLFGNDGLVAYDQTPGTGGNNPRRYHFETRKTLTMLHRAERQAVSDTDRDQTVAEFAFDQATSGPFGQVIDVRAESSPTAPVTTTDLRDLLEAAGIDRHRKTRLVILDSRWFSLLNGDDSATSKAIESALGLGDNPLAVGWASSAVFACVNTQLRRHARGIATEYLAWSRVVSLDAVKADKDMTSKARKNQKDAENRLTKAVKGAYQHVVFLSEDSIKGQTPRRIRLQKDNQSALDGSTVWAALTETAKAFGDSEFDAKVLIFNLRDEDIGRPLAEIRDSFWNTPAFPLLPRGESELRKAIYQAVADDKLELVNDDGRVVVAKTPADVNLATTTIRIRKPGHVEPAQDLVVVPDLFGKPPASARLELQATGLHAGVRGEADGTVVSQTPRAGTRVPAGETVSLEAAMAHPTEERQAVITTITSLRDDPELRDHMAALLREVSNAVDSNLASHLNLSLQISADTESINKIRNAADQACVDVNVV